MAPAILTLVLGGAFLGHASMWLDETITWFVSSQPVSLLARNSMHTDAMFLPYYLFMHFWLGVSHSTWWMRLPSLLAGAAAVQALVVLTRRWLPLGWAVLAGLLLALNPLFAAQAIQARPYTIATLFAVLSTTALVSAIDRGGRRRWALYGLASLCMLLTHLLAGLVLAAQITSVAITRRRTAWTGMLSAIGLACLTVSPLVVLNSRQAQEEAWIPPSALHTFHEALSSVSGGRICEVTLVISGLIVAASLSYTSSAVERASGFVLALAWGILPALLLVLVGFLHPMFVARYVVMSVPGIALIETFAAWRVSTFISARVRRRSLAVSTLKGSVACIAGFAFLHSAISVLQTPSWGEDFRAAAAELSSDLAKHPAPIAVVAYTASAGFSYYVTSPALAHEIEKQAHRAYNRHFLAYWGSVSIVSGSVEPPQTVSLLSWPPGPKAEASQTRCPAGWAIGRGPGPSTTLIVDGSSCLVRHINHYDNAWVASLNG